MLGMRSNRKPIKGAFADKLREEISIVQRERQSKKVQVQTKTSERPTK